MAYSSGDPAQVRICCGEGEGGEGGGKGEEGRTPYR
jgi:hypothetical protein